MPGRCTVLGRRMLRPSFLTVAAYQSYSSYLSRPHGPMATAAVAQFTVFGPDSARISPRFENISTSSREPPLRRLLTQNTAKTDSPQIMSPNATLKPITFFTSRASAETAHVDSHRHRDRLCSHRNVLNGARGAACCTRWFANKTTGEPEVHATLYAVPNTLQVWCDGCA